MDDEKWTLKNQIFDNLDEVAKLCKSPNDAYNLGGSQFSKYFLIKRVAKGKASDPHDFKAEAENCCSGRYILVACRGRESFTSTYTLNWELIL